MTQLTNTATLRSVENIVVETDYRDEDLAILKAILDAISWNLRKIPWGNVEYTGKVLFTTIVSGQLSVAAYLKLRSITAKSGWKVEIENHTRNDMHCTHVNVSIL